MAIQCCRSLKHSYDMRNPSLINKILIPLIIFELSFFVLIQNCAEVDGSLNKHMDGFLRRAPLYNA